MKGIRELRLSDMVRRSFESTTWRLVASRKSSYRDFLQTPLTSLRDELTIDIALDRVLGVTFMVESARDVAMQREVPIRSPDRGAHVLRMLLIPS